MIDVSALLSSLNTWTGRLNFLSGQHRELTARLRTLETARNNLVSEASSNSSSINTNIHNARSDLTSGIRSSFSLDKLDIIFDPAFESDVCGCASLNSAHREIESEISSTRNRIEGNESETRTANVQIGQLRSAIATAQGGA